MLLNKVYMCSDNVYVLLNKVYMCSDYVHVLLNKVYISLDFVYVLLNKVYICSYYVYVLLNKVYMCSDYVYVLLNRVYICSDYVYVLLNKAQREFHDMFTRTYGIMYQKNAEVFQEYFKDLKVYYDKGAINPATSTTTFFNTLYQKMFQVYNTNDFKKWSV